MDISITESRDDHHALLPMDVNQPVAFGLLGPTLVRDGDEQRSVTSGQQRVILAALLSGANHVVSIDSLQALLWQDQPSPAARSTIHSYVMRLRRAMGPRLGWRIRTRDSGYLMEVDPGELDIERFTAHIAAGKAALDASSWQVAAAELDAALLLWRGDAYSDVPAEALQRDEATHLEEQRLAAVEWSNDAALAMGRWAEVVPRLRRLVAEHPLRERFAAQLMIALYQAGRAGEALAVFQSVRHILADELGLDPSQQLVALHQRIIEGHPDAVGGVGGRGLPENLSVALPPIPAQLPAHPPCFTGRTKIAEELCALFSGAATSGRLGAAASAVITGMAGVGKTALAVHVAHQLRPSFADGQLYAHLGGTAPTPVSPAAVLRSFLRGLGMDPRVLPDEPAELSALLRTMLAGRSVLILLDDASNADQVLPLLPASEKCGVIVTSRNRCAHVDGSRFVSLGVLTGEEAHAMLAGLTGADRVAAEPEAANAIIRACGHLPLALNIAAARIASRPDWPVATLAGRLASERHRLTGLTVGTASVGASLAASHALLPREGTPSPATAFQLLGLWNGPDIGVPACAALFGSSTAGAEHALEALLGVHLAESTAPGRYGFHDLVRIYAAERAAAGPGPEPGHARERVLAWYLHTGAAVSAMLFPASPPIPLENAPPPPATVPSVRTRTDALAWYRAERACVAAAIHLAANAGLDTLAWTLAAVALRCSDPRNDWQTWLSTHQLALASAQRGGERALAWLQQALAAAQLARSHPEQAMESFLACVRDLAAAWRRSWRQGVIAASRPAEGDREEVVRAVRAGAQ